MRIATQVFTAVCCSLTHRVTSHFNLRIHIRNERFSDLVYIHFFLLKIKTYLEKNNNIRIIKNYFNIEYSRYFLETIYVSCYYVSVPGWQEAAQFRPSPFGHLHSQARSGEGDSLLIPNTTKRSANIVSRRVRIPGPRIFVTPYSGLFWA